MSRRLLVALFVLAVSGAVAALVACSSAPRSGGGSPAAPQGGSAVDAQVQQGAAVFSQMCAKCHGPSGEGSQVAPPLVGRGALPTNPPPTRRVRTMAFPTAMEVGQFILWNMPPPGGKIAKPDCAAVLAWLLRSNGYAVTQPISPTTAAQIPLNR